jgi:hypothetical protein
MSIKTGQEAENKNIISNETEQEAWKKNTISNKTGQERERNYHLYQDRTRSTEEKKHAKKCRRK